MKVLSPKQMFIKLFVIMLSLSLLLAVVNLTPAKADPPVRDRVVVDGSNVLTDTLEPLRGGPLTISKNSYCDPANPTSSVCLAKCPVDILGQECDTNWTLHPDNWVRMSKMGLNTGRITLFDFYNISTYNVENPSNTVPVFTISEILPLLDIAVDNAEAAGMYAVINYHDVGGLDPALLKDFWEEAAPRYADRTHVLYEIANEPGTLTTTSARLNQLADAYEIIRDHAPDTHVIHMSVASMKNNLVPVVNAYITRINNFTNTTLDFANGKDSVGFHTYGTTSSSYIVTLRNNFPVICTEWGYSPDQNAVKVMDGTIWHGQVMESLGISWIDWKGGRRDDTFINDYQRRFLAHARQNGYAWTSETFVGAFQQGFNSETIDAAPLDWTVSGQATIRPIPSSSNRSVLLFDDNVTALTSMSRSIVSQSDNVAVSFRIMQPNKTQFQAHVRDSSTSGAVFITRAGNFAIVDSTGTEQIIFTNYSANTWYNIVIAANVDTNKYDVFVNGALKASDVQFRNAVAELDTIYFETGLTTKYSTYIDAVRVNNP